MCCGANALTPTGPIARGAIHIVPVLYIITATVIMLILILYQTQDTWPGLVIVLLGVPVYLLWRKDFDGARFELESLSLVLLEREGAE